MSNTINIPCAIFKSISTFKKLMFEILETDHKELDELFNKRFPITQKQRSHSVHTMVNHILMSL